MGLIALQHVGSSQIRDGTGVSHPGRRILHHWATREALPLHWRGCPGQSVDLVWTPQQIWTCSSWRLPAKFPLDCRFSGREIWAVCPQGTPPTLERSSSWVSFKKCLPCESEKWDARDDKHSRVCLKQRRGIEALSGKQSVSEESTRSLRCACRGGMWAGTAALARMRPSPVVLSGGRLFYYRPLFQIPSQISWNHSFPNYIIYISFLSNNGFCFFLSFNDESLGNHLLLSCAFSNIVHLPSFFK